MQKKSKLEINKTTVKSLKNLTVKSKIKAGVCPKTTCDAGQSGYTI